MFFNLTLVYVRNLPFPKILPTFQTRHEDGLRFIRRPNLECVIGALARFAFGALEHIRGRFGIDIVFVRIDDIAFLKNGSPAFRVHFLVCHKRQRLRRDFPTDQMTD